mgnify:CR=1 FL=1
MSSEDTNLGPDLEEEFAFDYEDVRLELLSTGHNLTGVLMNPRDSMYDEFVEDFWDDMTSSSEHGSTPTTSTLGSSHGDSSSLSSHGSSHLISGLPIALANADTMKYLRKNYAKYQRVHSLGVQNASGTPAPARNSSSHNTNSSANTSTSSSAVDIMSKCFSEVPKQFFQIDFTLSAPKNFEQIINPQNGSSGGQQKKLNEYLDLVEYALLQQIWSRSSDIFSALDDIKGQQNHVAQAISRLNVLRKHLRLLDERVASSAIHIPLMHRRRGNETSLHVKLECMRRVIEGRNGIQALLEEGDYLGALDLVAECKEQYNTELVGITSMKKVGDQLDAYDGFVCEVISNKFVSMAIEWGEEGILEDSEFKEMNGVGDKTDSLSLGELLQALLQLDRLSAAFNMYRSRLVEGLRLVVRTCVTEYLSNFDPNVSLEALNGQEETQDDDLNDIPFAERIMSMNMDKFSACVSICFEHLLRALKRANGVHEYLMSALKNARKSKYIKDKNNEDNNQKEAGYKDMESLKTLSKTGLVSACDIAQKALSQLLLMRKSETARLSVKKMKSLWDTCMNFIVDTEKISGSSAYVMRQSLHTQISGFLSYVHEQSKLRLASTLDIEKWNQCNVPGDKQIQIDRLVSGRAFFKEREDEGNVDKNKLNVVGKFKTGGGNTGEGLPNGAIDKDKRNRDTTPIQIDGTKYKAAWSAVQLIEMLLVYLEIAVSFPPVTSDVITMTKELLQLFNKSTLSLVLGSGAQKSQAQLRSISAKHLTVTAQSLGLLVAVLPHARAALLTQLPPNRAMQLTELDRVSQELLEHHGKILTKFVIILGDSVDASMSKLKTLDWDQLQGRSEYFEDVIKNVSALHRVLLLDSMLPLEQVQDVFSRIFALLLRKLPSHFENIQPQTKPGRQRILDEVSHLSTALSLLQNINSSTEIAQLESTFLQKFGK